MRFLYIFIISLLSVLCHAQTVKNFEQAKDGVTVNLSEGTLGIYPIADNAVRVKFFKETETSMPELVFTEPAQVPGFKVIDVGSILEIKTSNITVKLDKQTGNLSYSNSNGEVFLNEKPGSRKLTAGTVMGEPCYEAEQSFESPSDEFLFGLGQFQDGHYNLKGVTRRLTQVNSQIAIPFVYSDKGYGVMWHQYGLTDFNPNDNYVTLEKHDQPAQGNKQMAEVTTTSGTQKVSQNQSLYNGKFQVPVDGVYSIFLDLGDMDNHHYVAIDGKSCIDFSNFWLPPTVSAFVDLKAGEHTVQLICKSSNKPRISWRLKENITTFRSPNAKLLDYIVFYGPSADEVIASYRKLSGNVPMFPQWAYGFWQCRERYTSGNQLVETVKEFRKRNIPMDVIVQDWQYWSNRGWGVPQFDTVNYANPAGFIKELHDLNAHFSISIWSNPDRNSSLGREYTAKNLYIPNSKWLDYFNPETRETYWNTLNRNMFANEVDSWWMDAVEPENDALKGEKTYAGLGDFYRLTYPYMVSKAVYEGQRKTSAEKRVCILTRSAFLGQQRYGIINWSGDIGGTWETYRRQIVAGLNYTITGFPYWTTDIGGFFRPGKLQYTDEKYHELLIRWYQWGTFNPIFRIHGYMTETEPWRYGQTVENNMRKMLTLRYRLLPYIYSDAWQVTQNGSTMMRPMVMDFNDDTTAVNCRFEFMFGKALLVAPVTEPNVTERNVYLPKNSVWYDFWTGKRYNGDQIIKADAPLDKIPLFVKSGSVLPMSKAVQFASEMAADTLEIRVYAGADGKFVLYEDEGDSYNYEKGVYSTITFTWNDTKKMLTISDRKGTFPGMLAQRKFNIICVTKNKGIGMEAVENYDKVLTYTGKKVLVKL
ncbi:MAG TPA: TIM-barrel domain-containing protein [Bacteroidales bacterium]